MYAQLIKEPHLSLNPSSSPFLPSNSLSGSQSTKSSSHNSFKPDPFLPCKKKLQSEPKTNQDIRHCQAVLTGLELQRILTGPNRINFGTIFVKSKVTQTFWVKNDNLNCVHVQVKIENQELAESYQLA
jgi:hypothetical protein